MATRTQTKAIIEAAMVLAGAWPRSNAALGRVHVHNDILVDGLYDAIEERTVKSIYDPTTALPVSPANGDAYIASATGSGWIKDHIYTWNGVSTWYDTPPREGMLVWIESEKAFYDYDGTQWEPMGATPGPHDHSRLVAPGTTTPVFYVDPVDGGFVFVSADGSMVKFLFSATVFKKFKWTGTEWADLFDSLEL